MRKLIHLLQSVGLVTGLVVGVIDMAGITFDARATLVKISQESSAGLGDFDANVLGYLNPFSTNLTTSAFYQFGSPIGLHDQFRLGKLLHRRLRHWLPGQ